MSAFAQDYTKQGSEYDKDFFYQIDKWSRNVDNVDEMQVGVSPITNATEAMDGQLSDVSIEFINRLKEGSSD